MAGSGAKGPRVVRRRWRRWLLVAATACGVAVVRGGEDGKPKLVCDEPTHDFGTVYNSNVVVHTFVLRNAGTAELKIERVRTSCGCTTTTLAEHRIAPGAQADLTAKFSLKGRRGEQHKSIFVLSNDPDSPNYRLSLGGTIVRDLEIEPQSVFFGRVAGEKEEHRSIRLLVRAEKAIHVTGLETNALAPFTADWSVVDEGRSYVVEVRLPADAARHLGRLKGELVVCTDHKAYRRVTIPVSAIVQGELSVSPSELVMRMDSAQSARDIIIGSREKRALKILDVTVPAEGVDVEIEKLHSGQQWIRLKDFPPSLDLDGQAIRIQVERSNGKVETVVIPIVVQGGD